MKIWFCKIGEVESLPEIGGADLPMRGAVAEAYERITGQEPKFIFSGWGAVLEERERWVVDDVSAEEILAIKAVRDAAGARVQVPLDEPLRALIESLRIHPPDRTWTGVSNPNARYNEALDDVLSLLPRSVQAQLLLTDSERLAIHDAAEALDEPTSNELSCILRALLARAARGQDG